MANILLNVDLNSNKAKVGLTDLEEQIKVIAENLQNIPVNKSLTSQINALTKYYNALGKAAQKTAKISTENARQEAKLFVEREKARKATAQADLAEEKLNETRRKGTQETKDATNANKKHEKGVLDMAKGFLQWQAAATLVMQPLQKLRGLVNDLNETLVETESAVITLTRVAGEEANSDDIYALAQKYGQSFENVSEVVERFAKSGYSWRDSISAAEEALIAMNVAELDAEQSTEGLISILKQFNLEIKDLATVNGILNKTADKYAVDTEELLFALQKTGSTARNAGLDLKETAGLITAISEGTAASGQNIGNALRSLFIFSSDKKALETFASLSDSMAETVKLYQAGGASILDVWKGLGQELNRLENKKGMLSELFGGVDLDSDLAANLTQIEDQFAEIYGTAGNYRQNYFISLLDNIETATKAVEDMTDVEEYSHQENDLAMETYEKKLARLDAKWKELANDEQGILSFKKTLVDIGLASLDLLDALGGIKTVLASVGIAGITALAWIKPDALTKFKDVLKSTINIIPNAVSAWKSYSAGVVSANTAISASIPLIGALSVGVTLLAGAISSQNEKYHEANQAAIDAANANREQLKTLEELGKKYNTLDKNSDEYKKTEQEIVSLLGEKGKILESLKSDQDAYTEAIKDSIQALKEEYKLTMRIGFESAKTELESHDVGRYDPSGSDSLMHLDEEIATGIIGPNSYSDLMYTDTLKTELYNYTLFAKRRDELAKGLLGLEVGSKEAGAIADLINAYDEQLAIDKGYIDDYLDTGSYLYLQDWLKDNELTSKNYGTQRNFATKYLLEQFGLTGEMAGFYRPMIEDYIDEWARTNLGFAAKDDGDTLDDTENSLEAIKEKYGDIRDELDEIFDLQKQENALAEKQNKILEEQVKLEEKRNKARQDAIINALKAERDGEKENLSLEEKRLAVEKARKQLEDAKKQRSVRVIDVSTGLFTRVESQPAVEEAEENLANAVETLKEYIEDQAWDSVIEAVENGNTDLASIRELLKSTLGKYSEDIGLFGSLALQTKIISAFKNGFNAPVDESGFSDGLDKAKKDYQEYQDNLLMEDVKRILSSDKLITLGDAISLLDKYKGVASDEALKIARDALADATGHDGMYMGYFGSKYGGAIADKMEEFANSIFGGNIFDTSGMEQYFSQNGVLHGTPQTHNNGSPIYQNSTVNNNQSQSYSINGVPIPAQAADEMSIAEFCRTVPLMIGFGH